VIEPPDDFFDAVVVEDDAGALICDPLDPDLYPPLVTVQPETLPLIVNQAMGCLEKTSLYIRVIINEGCPSGYNIISAPDQITKAEDRCAGGFHNI
jgi:hypothetical protein